MTSDSGPYPSSPTKNEYKLRFFDEPDCLSVDKKNIPPTESITPSSLKNLSLEKGTNDNKNKATSWEASAARNVAMTPRASSPYPKWTSTLEDLEPNKWWHHRCHWLSERPTNERRSLQPK